MSKQTQAQYIKELAYKWSIGTISPEEKKYFEEWYASFDDAEAIIESQKHKDLASLKAGIFHSLTEKIAIDEKVVKIVRWKKISMYAAGIAAVLAIVALLIPNFSDLMETQESRYANDIPPGKNSATITLGNGKKIILSDAKSGVGIADGVLRYNDGSSVSKDSLQIEDVVASTPKGGTYQFTLSDGTKVWLNAASSITFPTSFARSKSRIVMVTGEAYLEVAKDREHPFIVKNAQQEIEVLGTHFNINSYADEPAIETTLLEGSVDVNAISLQKHYLLSPGKQSVLSGANVKIIEVDTADMVAWKNGYFKFNDETIESIMRKLSRWYNIEVSYDSNVQHEKFTGRISRYKHINQVLKLMESGKSIKFKVEGRRVTLIR